MTPAFHFTNAIVRRPAQSVTCGLRADGGPGPSYDGVAAEHAAYVAALGDAGVSVTTLDPLEDFPDSVFVEDPALVFGEGAILLNPGAPSRAGEAAAIEPFLRAHFDNVVSLEEGHAEGGDVLALGDLVMIGLSARTDEKGACALQRALASFGRRAVIVETPKDVLHFKSDCALLDEETVLATTRLVASGVFEGMRVIETAEGEERAANALRINDVLLVSAGCPRTSEALAKAGYALVPLKTDEIAKIDAGLSCMSLRWRTP